MISVKDFESESMIIDCSKITLEPISEGGLKILRGPGSIIQKAGGGFRLKVFVEGGDKVKNALAANLKFALERLNRIKPGKVISSSEYYRMKATDLTGDVWSCDRLYPYLSYSKRKSVLTADLHEITKSTPIPKTYKIENYFRAKIKGKFDIPTNSVTKNTRQISGMVRHESSSRNVCVFTSCKIDIEIIQESEWMEISACSKAREFDEIFGYRIMEAIQLCMGRPLDWSSKTIVKKSTELTTFRGIVENNMKGRACPPVNILGRDNVESTIRLMDCYLEKTIDSRDTSVHPLFRPLYAVMLASQSALEAEALVLSTSIESMLDNLGKEYRKDNKTSSYVKQLRKHIEAGEYPINFKKRAKGLISMMESPSAVEKLNHLVKDGTIDETIVAAWKKLRPKLAHGNYSIGYFQEFLDMVHSTHVLLHQLFFHCVGYRGKFRDYSNENWPDRTYPQSNTDKLDTKSEQGTS